MNLYEIEWLARDRLDEAREFAARQALAGGPTLRLWLGALLIRLGTWLQDRAADPDVEAKRAPA